MLIEVQSYLAHCGHARVLHGAKPASICTSNGFEIESPCRIQPAPCVIRCKDNKSLAFKWRPLHQAAFCQIVSSGLLMNCTTSQVFSGMSMKPDPRVGANLTGAFCSLALDRRMDPSLLFSLWLPMPGARLPAVLAVRLRDLALEAFALSCASPASAFSRSCQKALGPVGVMAGAAAGLPPAIIIAPAVE